jgi:hypothetical protein
MKQPHTKRQNCARWFQLTGKPDSTIQKQDTVIVTRASKTIVFFSRVDFD